MLYDVIIAGAGVTGAFAARTLSGYELKVCILEKGNDAASGASRANSGIVHAGYDCMPGSLKALLNIRGAQMMEKIASELDVPYKKTGSLVAGFGDSDLKILKDLMERGILNGVNGLEILDGEAVRLLEPMLSDKITHALYSPSAAIVCPYELTIAAVENAVENGAELFRNREVKGISFHADHIEVDTDQGSLNCRYFINAAGACAGLVAQMAGDHDIAISPRKGEYLLFDKKCRGTVNHVVFQCPTSMGKGVLVTPTVDGNLMIGPSAEDTDDFEDCPTTAQGLAKVAQSAGRVLAEIDLSQVITSFAGLRAKASGKDFIIRPSRVNPAFIHAAGIDSPGLTCAPAIGEYIRDILKNQGLEMVPKNNWKRTRDKVLRFRELGGSELDMLLKRDPSYSKIVCRCEKVTEGEVLDCIRRPAGALDVDSVKRRTRAGMGRCQGGFCTPRIVELLSRELGLPYDQITKKGKESWMLAGKTK